MKKEIPDKNKLLECFDYLEDGQLQWKARPRNHFKSDLTHKSFNTRFPGSIAGSRRGDQYFYTYISGIPYANHRIVAKMFDINLDQHIDHIDGNKANNRFENLRPASINENFSNRKINIKNRSGIKGLSVTANKQGKMYFQCEIQHKNVRHIKHFPYCDENKLIAIDWIEWKRIELHKEFANHGNGSVLLNKE